MKKLTNKQVEIYKRIVSTGSCDRRGNANQENYCKTCEIARNTMITCFVDNPTRLKYCQDVLAKHEYMVKLDLWKNI